ncbi:MAG: CoA transferase [Proteobacteria bacterium]|nr:CoA transferase [Pseudomonadota bacterium]
MYKSKKNAPESFGPLAGLKVLDAGNMIAGPLAATQMADFGAEVIKVELPKHGDSMRHWSPIKDGKSLWWKVIGRNKKLITLALSKPEGRALFLDLIKSVDVVIENFRPGTFERWGLSYQELAAVNPRLIMVRVSGFGQTGPYSSKGGYGTVAEAFSGVPSFTGFPDKPPTLPGFPLADSLAATFSAMAAMFAVYKRDNGDGRGQEVDVSLYEPLFRLVEAQVIGFDQLNLVKERIGNRLAEDSPRNTYETKDGRWLGISASSQKTYERLALAIERPDLITDERFVNNAVRCDNADALDAIIAQWIKQHTLQDIMALFDSRQVVAGPVLNIKDIFSDPQYLFRKNIIDVEDEDFGTVKMQNVVPSFSDTPGKVRHSGGQLGKDNRAIFIDSLGLSEERFQELTNQGVI